MSFVRRWMLLGMSSLMLLVVGGCAVFLLGLDSCPPGGNFISLYWADGGNKIQSANLDGTGVTALVTGLTSPLGIALR